MPDAERRRGRGPAGTRHLRPTPGRRRLRRARDGYEAGSTVHRLPIVLAVVALLAVGGLIDRAAGGPGTDARTAADTPGAVGAVSVVAPGDALSSSWFCGGATDEARAEAPGQFEVTNAGPGPISGTATIVASNGARHLVTLRVPGEGHVTVPERVPGGAPWVGATVNLEGGLASVEQEVVGHLGASSTPCATTTSRSWYFTSGATLVNAGVELSLLNPYPADAIVDLTMTTNEGVEQPGGFQGLVVPAHGMLAVDLGSHLRRRQRIATTVTARTGRVVAWKTDIVTPPAAGEATIGSPQAADAPDPAAPVGGVAVTLGSPSTGTLWTWPEGDTGNGFNEQYTIYNPGVATADVVLTIGLDLGSAEPLDLSVAPESVATVVSNQQARVPAGVGHFAQVRSTNGVPVVAERTLAVARPSAISGLGELPGIRSSASEWLLGADAEPASSRGYLVVDNPGRTPVRVSVAAVAHGRTSAIRGLSPFTIPVGRRASFLLNSRVAPQTALLVKGTAPIIVERDFYGTGKAPGVSLSPGVPFIVSSQAELAR